MSNPIKGVKGDTVTDTDGKSPSVPPLAVAVVVVLTAGALLSGLSVWVFVDGWLVSIVTSVIRLLFTGILVFAIWELALPLVNDLAQALGFPRVRGYDIADGVLEARSGRS